MLKFLANANFSTIPYGPIVRFVLRKGNIVQINSRGTIPVHFFDNRPPKNRLLSKTALTLQTWLNEIGEEFMDFSRRSDVSHIQLSIYRGMVNCYVTMKSPQPPDIRRAVRSILFEESGRVWAEMPLESIELDGAYTVHRLRFKHEYIDDKIISLKEEDDVS